MNCRHCGGNLSKNCPNHSGVAKVIYQCHNCKQTGLYSDMIDS